MNRSRSGSDGFALAVVLVVSSVALAAAVGGAMLASLSARQVASLESRSTTALFAAESGLNALLARANTSAYEYDHGSVGEWISDVGLSEYDLPNEATVQLQAFLTEESGIVTIRSQGTAPDGSTRVIFQDFELDEGIGGWSNPNEAALVTIPPLKTNAKKSRLVGLGDDEGSWVFDGHEARDAYPGEYVVVEGVTYKVLSVADDGATVDAETVGETRTPSQFAGSDPVSLVPYALTAAYEAPYAYPMEFTVTDPSRYPVGTGIRVGDGVGWVTEVSETSITVSWDPASEGYVAPLGDLSEGTPVRKLVPSALAQTGGCPEESDKLDEKLPQGCDDGDLGDLFASTFPGYTKSELFALAANYDDELASEVFSDSTPTSWPTGDVEGLTWIDGASTGDANSKALCGTGVVILNTGPSVDETPGSININVSGGCEFTGVLYVMGQLSLAGNLDSFSGMILTEGPGKFTNVQGTGDKSLYDPIAVREAMNNLDFQAGAGLFAAIPSTWRFGE